jgi:hypothetical protein
VCSVVAVLYCTATVFSAIDVGQLLPVKLLFVQQLPVAACQLLLVQQLWLSVASCSATVAQQLLVGS